tara:strand:+ start:2045 stop:2653 length:609 start_codon:yes stop_codon:yes gene_type:complete
LYAVTYNGTNLLQLDGNDLAVVDNTGTAIVSGTGIVASGYFNTFSDAAVASATLSDVSSLIADFVILGSDNFTGFDPDGLYNFSADPTAPSATPSLVGKNLYTFYGNNTTLESSLQVGLYQSLSVIDDGGINPEAYKVNLPDGGNAIFGSEATHAKVQIDATSLGESSTFMTDSFTLVSVPEPSSTALLGLGAFGLLLRRRR